MTGNIAVRFATQRCSIRRLVSGPARLDGFGLRSPLGEGAHRSVPRVSCPGRAVKSLAPKALQVTFDWQGGPAGELATRMVR